MPLKVIRASAGSGKTFKLVEEYLTLCLGNQNPYYFENILALTFTNKATAEMKERILETLHQVQSGDIDHALAKQIKRNLNISEEELISRAGKIWNALFRHYDRIQIRTIDSFCYYLLRLLALEAKLDNNFQVELDQKTFFGETVIKIMEEWDEEHEKWPYILQWLEYRISNDTHQDVARQLQLILKEIYKESVFEIIRDWPEPKMVKEFIDKIHFLISDINGKFKENKEKLLGVLKRYEIDPGKFKGATKSFVNSWLNPKNDLYHLTRTIQTLKDANEDTTPEKKSWFRKGETPAHNIKEAIPEIETLLREVITLGNEYSKFYPFTNTLQGLPLQRYLLEEVRRQAKEQNKMLNTDINRHLVDFIIEDNIPVIYEKTGNQFHHIMIDEFQDTSTLQYLILCPLLLESVANNHLSLIVGDVKQAIYRFRNGDWTLMQKQLSKDFSGFIETETLKKNWRSSPAIIEFNNSLLKNLIRHPEIENDIIYDIYNDLEQEIPVEHKEKLPQGYVECNFYTEGPDKKATVIEEIASDIYDHIITLTDEENFNQEDIAILVRDSKTMAIFKEVFDSKENHIKLITKKAFALKYSCFAQYILSGLKYLEGIDNSVNEYTLYRQWCLLRNDEFDPEYPTGNWVKNVIAPSFQNIGKTDVINKIHKLIELLERQPEESEIQILSVIISGWKKFMESFTLKTSSYPDYLEEYLMEQDLKAEGQENAVRIMTQHSSKGLQFPVVIAVWDKDKIINLKEPLWMQPPIEHEAIKKLPGKVKENDAELFEDAEEEILMQKVDHLNLIYVTCTRAKTRLYIYANTGKKSSLTVGRMIYEALNEPEDKYSYGEKTIKTAFTESIEDLIQLSHYYIRQDPISVAEGYLPQSLDTEEPDAIRRGQIIHKILEELEDHEELDKVLSRAITEGWLTEENRDALRSKLKRLLEAEDVRVLFQSGQKAYIEQEIVTPDGKFYRPDRVIEKKDIYLLIDFKSGQKRDYSAQMKKYEELLNSISNKEVKSYILYTDKPELEEIG